MSDDFVFSGLQKFEREKRRGGGKGLKRDPREKGRV